jgi:hypothetical protein
MRDDDRLRMRKGLLQAEREESRATGQRILLRFAERRDPELSPIACSGLASSYYWAGNLSRALFWARHAVANYPMSSAAVWCSGLLVALYRSMGMRRERFEAERERILLMKRIAFQSSSRDDRIYALRELQKELESRDLDDDARKCADELRDLLAARPSGNSIAA